MQEAIWKYNKFHGVSKNAAKLSQVVISFAGTKGYLEVDERSVVRVGNAVVSAGLCGPWVKQALSAAAELPQWERVVLTVVSGVSDAVIPPSR